MWLILFVGGVGGGQMVEMIFQFADFALKKCPEQGKIQVLEQHFHVSQNTIPEIKHCFCPQDSLFPSLWVIKLSLL